MNRKSIYLVIAAGLLASGMPASVSQAIIGGRNADTSQENFTVKFTLVTDPTPFCTGVLIATNWVLTAEHCIEYGNKKAADYFISTSNPTAGMSYKLASDSDYHRMPGGQHDVALLKLPDSVPAPAIPISRNRVNIFTDTPAKITGWGFTGPSVSPFSTAQQLQQTDQDTKAGCSDDEYLCVPTTNASAGPGEGDSGAPLHYYDSTGTAVLIGIFKGNDKPGRERYQAHAKIYTRYSVISDWVDRTISGQ